MATIDAVRFIELLLNQHGPAPASTAAGAAEDRLPSGPWDPADSKDPQDTTLIVADGVDLRGRTLEAIFLYGARFRGRVDLRNTTIRGPLDLTACVFEEGLRLDDSKVQGSLTLARISIATRSDGTEAQLSMIGISVRGRLNLRGAQTDGEIRLFDADVRGFVDLRGLSAASVKLRGSRIHGDLRIGRSRHSQESPSEVGSIDAIGCTIGARVTVTGSGPNRNAPSSARLPASDDAAVRCAALDAGFRWPADAFSIRRQELLDIDLSGATIGGAFEVLPYIAQDEPFDSSDTMTYEIEHDATLFWPSLGHVKLTGARIGGNLMLRGALIARGLEADHVHVGGSLYLQADFFEVQPDDEVASLHYPARQTDIRGLLQQPYAVKLDAARIDGNLFVKGVRFGGTVDFTNAAVGGNTFVEPFQWPGAAAHGFGFVEPTTIHGALWMYLSKLKGPVELYGVRIASDLLMWSLEAHYVHLNPKHDQACTIGGNLDLYGAKLPQFHMYGTQVAGRLRASGCDIGELRARPGRLVVPERVSAAADGWQTADSIVMCHVGQFQMRNGNIAGDMDLEYLHVTGREIDGERGLVLDNARVGGSLSMFGEDAIVRTYLEGSTTYAAARAACVIKWREFSAAVVGDVRIRRSHIGAALNFTALKVDGCIDLEDSHIGGDLCFAAVTRTDGESPNRAVCRALRLRMLRCDNDVDLSGLTVIADDDLDETSGGIDGHFLTVEGDLHCARTLRTPDDRPLPVFAQVTRDIDLSYAKLAHLVISGRSFEHGAPARRLDRGALLLLDRTRVGKLEVLETRQERPLDDESPALPSYPELSLIDVDIEAWDIEGEARENAGAAKYVNLLANDYMPAKEPFRRSTYQSLEATLRKSGNDDHADVLYRAMQRREWRHTRSGSRLLAAFDGTVSAFGHPVNDFMGMPGIPALAQGLRRVGEELAFGLAAVKHQAFRHFLKFGTSPSSLLLVILALFLVSLPVYRTAANFEPTLPYVIVPAERIALDDPTPRLGLSPRRAKWTVSDGLQIALKNHLPMVPLQARGNWQARDDGPTTYSWSGRGDCHEAAPAAGTHCIDMAPEDLFNYMQLINWICWPILLTFFIRRLLRQT